MKKLFTLLTMLIVAITSSWADETYYLQTPGASTPALTGDFYTTAALSQDVTCSYNDVNYTKAVKMGGNLNAWSSNQYLDRMIRYDCKTTKTDFTVVVYSKGNNKSFYVGSIKESALGSALTPSTFEAVSATQNAVTPKTYSITSTTPASFYVSSNANNDLFIVQIIAVESGDPLPTPGTPGYYTNFNKGRIVCPVSNGVGQTYLDNSNYEFNLSSTYKGGNSTEARIKTKGSNYVKFTTTEATKLTVAVSSSNTYYISSTIDASETPAPTAYTATAEDVELAAGTWYIVPNGYEVKLTGLSFAASTPATTYEVTYKANGGTGDDVVDNVSVVGANTFAAPTGKKFVGWNTEADGTGDAYAVGAAVTEPLTLFAQWAEFTTLFSMTSITGPTEQVASQDKAPVTATFSTGGSAEVFNAHGSNPATMVLSNTIFLTSSGNSYCHVSFPSKLQAGDVIALGETTGIAYLATTSTKPNSNSKVTIPYTIPTNSSLIGATDLYIFNNKDGDTEQIGSFSEFTITGAGKASDLAVTSATPININVGGESTIETSSSSTGAITFASSDASVAKVSDTGVITAVGGGTATITINQAADDNYRAGATKVTVTVIETALVKARLTGSTTANMTGSMSATYSGKTQNVDSKVGGCKLGSKGTWTGFTLNGDNTLKAGDIVEVKISQRNGSTPFVFYDSKEQTNTLLTTTVYPEPGVYRFVLPAEADGKSGLFLVRGDENGEETGTQNTGFNPHVVYIALYRPDAVVTLNSKGFATYSSAYDFEYLGADAYGMELTATSLQGTKVTTGKIAAGEGILFKGKAGATVAITETTGAEALENNSLIGTTDINNDIVPSTYTYKYALSGDTFKRLTGALVANKAFFGTNEELSNSLDIVFDGATAINNVNANDNANSAAPVKVIKNGKLYIGNYNVAGARIK